MPIPADLVLASASGLDPHISTEAALLQVPRIARERKISQSVIEKIVHQNTENPFLGYLGNAASQCFAIEYCILII